jgi:hypothetical protein
LRTLARIREALNKDKRQVNTILTGHVVAQMLEILYPSLPDAYPDIRASVAPSEDTRQLFEPVLERVALPEEALSVWYQIAEYFQLEDANGAAVIQEKGQLTSPQVDTWSASIILSIAVIIVEQLLVQYLAPGSIHYGMESVFGQNLHHLAEALGEPTFVEAVQLEARRIDGEKTVFGRQRSDCHRLVETIRSYTGLSTIIEMLQKSDYARFTTDPKAQQALFSLKKMGRVLQESTFASFASKQGKGINAGIDIIIHHYCPEGQPIVL